MSGEQLSSPAPAAHHLDQEVGTCSPATGREGASSFCFLKLLQYGRKLLVGRYCSGVSQPAHSGVDNQSHSLTEAHQLYDGAGCFPLVEQEGISCHLCQSCLLLPMVLPSLVHLRLFSSSSWSRVLQHGGCSNLSKVQVTSQ